MATIFNYVDIVNSNDDEMSFKVAGVYAIKNEINGGYYIGESSDIFETWRVMISELNCSESKKYKLQNDWNKYDELDFSFIILEDLTPKRYKRFLIDWGKFISILICRKHHFINKYNSVEEGYNWSDSYVELVSDTYKDSDKYGLKKKFKSLIRRCPIDRLEHLDIERLAEYIKSDTARLWDLNNIIEDDDIQNTEDDSK